MSCYRAPVEYIPFVPTDKKETFDDILQAISNINAAQYVSKQLIQSVPKVLDPSINIQDLLGPVLSSKLNIAKDENVKRNLEGIATGDKRGQQIDPVYKPEANSLKAQYESVFKNRVSTFGPPAAGV